MRQIFKNVKQKLVSKYIKNSSSKNTKDVLQTVKEQLVSNIQKTIIRKVPKRLNLELKLESEEINRSSQKI